MTDFSRIVLAILENLLGTYVKAQSLRYKKYFNRSHTSMYAPSCRPVVLMVCKHRKITAGMS